MTGPIETDDIKAPDKHDADALDSLNILPFSILPLKTAALRNSYMIKNARLESVIELFRDSSAGSGQIEPQALTDYYQDTPDLRSDLQIIETVAKLESFDIYSLRAELRNLDIGFTDHDALQLSEKKRDELTSFMSSFTRPLITRIYGQDKSEVQDVSQIIRMLAQPDPGAAMKQLQRLAAELKIEIMEVPTFLERYGDLFLSLSYFRNCLDEIKKDIPELISWMNDIRDSYEVRNDKMQNQMLDQIEAHLNSISKSISGRFEMFDQYSMKFWDDINAESFRQFGDLVTAHHTSVGAVLCGLAVKIMRWKERFPNVGGGPAKRLEFIQTEVRPGLDRIRRIEQNIAIAMRET